MRGLPAEDAQRVLVALTQLVYPPTAKPGRAQEAEHGTVSMYNNHKCRCQKCRIAANAYNKQRRRRKGKGNR